VNQEGREKTGLREQIRRELGVMFSRRHQPVPLRVAKWAVFLAVARRLYGTRWFRAWVFGLPIVGLGAHFFYRYMTRGWTEPWGGTRWMPPDLGSRSRTSTNVGPRREESNKSRPGCTRPRGRGRKGFASSGPSVLCAAG
jgi:hypothetical protein